MPKAKKRVVQDKKQHSKNMPLLSNEENEEEEEIDFRETFKGCALTEEECDALGIDFMSHNMNL